MKKQMDKKNLEDLEEDWPNHSRLHFYVLLFTVESLENCIFLLQALYIFI